MPRYKSYYGRRKLRWLKWLLILLLAGGLVPLCVFVLPNYVTFTDEGISIDLPFFSKQGRATVPTPSPSVPELGIIIETPAPSPPAPEPSPPPSPTPVKPAPARALFIPLALFGDIDALEVIKGRALAEGINTLVLEYKNTAGGVADADSLTAALTVLSDPGLELTALIPACVDNAIPLGANTAWAVKHRSGKNFLDGGSDRWLNLYMPEVREYIAGLVGGAYQAGFERVLLSHIGFPHTGGIIQVDYRGEAEAIGPVNAVNTLLSELRDTFPEAALDAWIYTETASEGIFETAGQSLNSFEDTFDRLYVTLTAEISSAGEGIIPVIPVGGEAGESFMLYSETGEYFTD